MGQERTIYHGSKVVVEYPEIRKGRFNKDFYFGFYCTTLPEQAVRISFHTVRALDTLHFLKGYEVTDEE